MLERLSLLGALVLASDSKEILEYPADAVKAATVRTYPWLVDAVDQVLGLC